MFFFWGGDINRTKPGRFTNSWAGQQRSLDVICAKNEPFGRRTEGYSRLYTSHLALERAAGTGGLEQTKRKHRFGLNIALGRELEDISDMARTVRYGAS